MRKYIGEKWLITLLIGLSAYFVVVNIPFFIHSDISTTSVQVDPGSLPTVSPGGAVNTSYKDEISPKIYNIKITEITEGSFEVQWFTTESAKGGIYYRTVPDGEEKYVATDGFSAEHFKMVDGLKSNQRYEFRIYAEDRAGNSSYSEWIEVKISDSRDFIRTPNVFDFRAIVVGQQVELSWQNPKENDFDYVVVVRQEKQENGTYINQRQIYQGPEESFVDVDIESGVTYRYVIFSHYTDGRNSTGSMKDVVVDEVVEEFEEEVKELVFEEVEPLIYLEEVEIELDTISPSETTELKVFTEQLIYVTYDPGESEEIDYVSAKIGDDGYLMEYDQENQQYGTEIYVPGEPGEYDLVFEVIYLDGESEESSSDLEVMQYGKVVDENDFGILDAEITLYILEEGAWQVWDDQRYLQSAKLSSGEDGQYAYYVPDGTYRIVVKKEGYLPYRSEDMVIEDGLINAVIELKKIPASEKLLRMVKSYRWYIGTAGLTVVLMILVPKIFVRLKIKF